MSSSTVAKVAKPAPNFELEALVGTEFKTVKLSDYKGRYLLIQFYPLDFTFICPTEILGFNDRYEEFQKLGCDVIFVSVDSAHTHYAWTQTERKKGGLGGPLNFPLLSDLSKKMSIDYDVLHEDGGHTLRGQFIIDGKGIVRQITKNHDPVGRSVDEALRLVQAYQFTDEHGEVCPLGWTPGSATIKDNQVDKLEYFGKHA